MTFAHGISVIRYQMYLTTSALHNFTYQAVIYLSSGILMLAFDILIDIGWLLNQLGLTKNKESPALSEITRF